MRMMLVQSFLTWTFGFTLVTTSMSMLITRLMPEIRLREVNFLTLNGKSLIVKITETDTRNIVAMKLFKPFTVQQLLVRCAYLFLVDALWMHLQLIYPLYLTFFCVVANWDDHEHTNNVYGYGHEVDTGAENHQPVCSAPRNGTEAQKRSAACDRDEGSSTTRFTCSGTLFGFLMIFIDKLLLSSRAIATF